MKIIIIERYLKHKELQDYITSAEFYCLKCGYSNIFYTEEVCPYEMMNNKCFSVKHNNLLEKYEHNKFIKKYTKHLLFIIS